MKAVLLATLLLLAPSVLFAGDAGQWDGNFLSSLALPADKQAKQLQTLPSLAVPSGQAARDLATGAWGHLLRSNQMARVVGLWLAASGEDGMVGFASPGDWVWEVHIGGLVDLNGIVLINARTKKVHVFPVFPER